jgi:hypothetical protein
MVQPKEETVRKSKFRSVAAIQRNVVRSKVRRDTLRAAGLCINGRAHGSATHGRLCENCRNTHRGKNRSIASQEASL